MCGTNPEYICRQEILSSRTTDLNICHIHNGNIFQINMFNSHNKVFKELPKKKKEKDWNETDINGNYFDQYHCSKMLGCAAELDSVHKSYWCHCGPSPQHHLRWMTSCACALSAALREGSGERGVYHHGCCGGVARGGVLPRKAGLGDLVEMSNCCSNKLEIQSWSC